MMKHTPSPWYFRPDDSSVEAQTPTGYNFRVANCADSSVLDLETMKANSKLIAAAPDMLEALCEALAALRWTVTAFPDIPESSSFRQTIETVRQAIARATE